jgi:cytochrome b561
MTRTLVFDADDVASPPRRHDAVSMTLHWLTLLLLTVLFGSMWLREQASDGYAAALLLTLHRSSGALIWIITLGRLVWKQHFGQAPTLPSTMPRPQQWAARANEYMLYLLLIAQPITGFVQTIARGKPFVLLGVEVP